ncbi:MAG TPA: hypothetical protein PKA29_00150 [Candidatus Saccharibacteria bacterium]|jgi:hypothetical protein|nr:hypothetical protein [Candidatus Saccharibacteria bacterium]
MRAVQPLYLPTSWRREGVVASGSLFIREVSVKETSVIFTVMIIFPIAILFLHEGMSKPARFFMGGLHPLNRNHSFILSLN